MTISVHGLAVCTPCGRPIRWSRTEADRAMPLDAEPDERGNVVARLGEGPTWYSRIPTPERPQTDVERRFMPHFATCPARTPQRPPQPPPAPPGPLPEPEPPAHQELPLPLDIPDQPVPTPAPLAHYRRTRTDPT